MAVLLAAVVVVLVASGAASAQVVMVTSDRVNLRAEPGMSSRVVSTLGKGALVEVQEQVGEWYRVRTLAGDQEGYLHQSVVSVPPPARRPRTTPPAKLPPVTPPERPATLPPAAPVEARAAPARKPAGSRALAWVNGAWQATSRDFNDTSTFELNVEEASLTSNYTVPAGPAIDAGLAIRVWRNLYLGAGATRFSTSDPASVQASLPHPFDFDRYRQISGESGGLEHTELAVNALALVSLPAGNRVQVGLFAGPAWFQVRRAFVTGVEFDESYPYDEATFTSATATTLSESQTGFAAGADVAFLLTRGFGLGVLVRYSQASIDFSTGSGTMRLDVGGLQLGGGVRLRF